MEEVCWKCVIAMTLTVVIASYGVHGNIDPSSVLGCYPREYTYNINKPFETDDGKILHCHDNVTVLTCWGRCDTHEIADYKIPYKISNHPVCNYGKVHKILHKLRNCHPAHPEPETEVLSADTCQCRRCSPHDTKCESMNGY